MNDPVSLPGMDIDGLRVWPDPDDACLWYWLPLAPSPRRDANGKLRFALVEAGPVVLLNLDAQWTAPDDVLAALPARIAALAHCDSAALRVAAAPATVTEASLVARAAGGDDVLARGRASGFGVNNVALSATASGDAATALARAIKQGGDGLRVRYAIDVDLPQRAQASLSGSLTVAAPGDEAALRDAIATAIDSGSLRYADDADDAELRGHARDAAIDQAVASLARIGHGSAPASLDVKATARASRRVALVQEAPLRRWLDNA